MLLLAPSFFGSGKFRNKGFHQNCKTIMWSPKSKHVLKYNYFEQPRDYGRSTIDSKNNWRFNKNKSAEDSSYKGLCVRLAPIGLAMGLGGHAWWLGCLWYYSSWSPRLGKDLRWLGVFYKPYTDPCLYMLYPLVHIESIYYFPCAISSLKNHITLAPL